MYFAFFALCKVHFRLSNSFDIKYDILKKNHGSYSLSPCVFCSSICKVRYQIRILIKYPSPSLKYFVNAFSPEAGKKLLINEERKLPCLLFFG